MRLESFEQRIKSSFGSVTVEQPSNDLEVGNKATLSASSTIVSTHIDLLMACAALQISTETSDRFLSLFYLLFVPRQTRVPQEASKEHLESTTVALVFDSGTTATPAFVSPVFMSPVLTHDFQPVISPSRTSMPPVSDAPQVVAVSSNELSAASHQEHTVERRETNCSDQKTAGSPGCRIT